MRRTTKLPIFHVRELAITSKMEGPPPPLTATARIYGGPGVGLAEVQACVEPPSNGKGRILTTGIPKSEIEQILATVLIPTLIGSPDYVVSVKLVAADRFNPSFGLAVAVAINGSYLTKPIPENFVFMGEIDLHKNIRGGNQRIIENLRRSIDCGEVDPAMSLVLPSSLRAMSVQTLGVTLVPCADLIDAISAVWQVTPR